MNRIVGNVIIIDSAMGNALILTSANQAVNIDTFFVNAIALAQADTSASVTLSESNTSNVVVKLDRNLTNIPFASPQRFSQLKVPTLTAGTAFIYLA